MVSLQESWLEEIQEGEYKVSVMVAWIILRSLSFSLEICDTDPDGQLQPIPLLTMLLGYCLYLPFLCTGPYMPFTDFHAGVCHPFETCLYICYVLLVVLMNFFPRPCTHTVFLFLSFCLRTFILTR